MAEPFNLLSPTIISWGMGVRPEATTAEPLHFFALNAIAPQLSVAVAIVTPRNDRGAKQIKRRSRLSAPQNLEQARRQSPRRVRRNSRPPQAPRQGCAAVVSRTALQSPNARAGPRAARRAGSCERIPPPDVVVPLRGTVAREGKLRYRPWLRTPDGALTMAYCSCARYAVFLAILMRLQLGC